jgi:tRNA pseudouridine55 synthase
LARDLGAALGVGGHLTALRRTRVGPYTLDQALSMEALERDLALLPLAAAVHAAFPRRDLTAEEAVRVLHGGQLPAVGHGPGPVGAFAPDGTVVALVEERAGLARPLAVFS